MKNEERKTMNAKWAEPRIGHFALVILRSSLFILFLRLLRAAMVHPSSGGAEG
jgi:hypothetical protein